MMNWFESLFVDYSSIQAMVVISIICAVGLLLGKVKVRGVSLGVAFVFFIGILAGHIGLSVDPQMLVFAQNFGLVIFVYELGLQVGPGFFSTFRSGGLKMNMLGLCVVALGTVMAISLTYVTPIQLSDMVGILCCATDLDPVGIAVERCGAELCGDLSARSAGCYPGHNPHAPVLRAQE